MSITNNSNELFPTEHTEEKIEFCFHEDPGHGWLEVPIALIKKLGITKQITSCSYRKADIAYLEEDLDATTFINAYLISIGKSATDYHFFHSLTRRCFTNESSFVRRLRRF